MKQIFSFIFPFVLDYNSLMVKEKIYYGSVVLKRQVDVDTFASFNKTLIVWGLTIKGIGTGKGCYVASQKYFHINLSVHQK